MGCKIGRVYIYQNDLNKEANKRIFANSHFRIFLQNN